MPLEPDSWFLSPMASVQHISSSSVFTAHPAHPCLLVWVRKFRVTATAISQSCIRCYRVKQHTVWRVLNGLILFILSVDVDVGLQHPFPLCRCRLTNRMNSAPKQCNCLKKVGSSFAYFRDNDVPLAKVTQFSRTTKLESQTDCAAESVLGQAHMGNTTGDKNRRNATGTEGRNA